MRKLVLILAMLFLTSSVAAVDAVISPGNPDDIILNSTNNWEKNGTYDAESSSGQGTLSYTWNWAEESESDSGIDTKFAFDLDKSKENTIKLTVSNGTNCGECSDVDEVTQVLRDEPRIKKIRSDETVEVDVDDIKQKVDFNATSDYSINDTFDDSLSYSWSIEDPDSDKVYTDTGNTASYEFTDNSSQPEGDYDVTLNVTDDYGLFNWDNSLTITVDNITDTSSDDSNNNNQDNENEEGGGGGAGTTSDDEDGGSEFDEVKEVAIDEDETGDFEFDESPVTEVAITASEVLTGELKSEASDSLPAGPGSAPEDDVYRYVELEDDFVVGETDEVEFDFEVEKDWVSENDIANETVTLQRYNDGWEKLDTSMEDEDDDYFYYSASSSGFSVFSITGEKAAAEFKVTGIDAPENVSEGETFEINVTVENNGNRAGSYNLSVDVGGETLTEEIELEKGGQTSVVFESSIDDIGTETISVGSEQVQVNVEGESGLFSGIMFVVAFVLVILAIAGGVLFYIEKEEELDLDSEGAREIFDGLLERFREEDESDEYSFEGFGDDDEGYLF